MKKNTGKDYEVFVAKIQQALLNAEEFAKYKNITVEVDKKIEDNCGVKRQFDIYWEYELGGITYKTVIECKDYDSIIPLEKIDALIGKTQDLPDLKAVFATKKGYQSGARKKAEQNKIDLLIVREQNDSDWEAPEGTPLIKEIHIDMRIQMPARISNFEPFVDEGWVKEHTDIDTSKPMAFQGLNSEIIIDDVKNEESYSLHTLESRLKAKGDAEYGDFDDAVKFEDAYITYSNEYPKLKLGSYKIYYSISKPVSQPILIDFGKELIGVVEYIQKGSKKAIFKNGVVK